MRQKTGGWFSVIIGAVLLLVGLVWGLVGSHQVSYVNSLQNVTYRIAIGSDSGNVYIHQDGLSEYFVALKTDFSPAIAQSDIDNSTGLSFVARTDTTSVDLNANGTTITEAHKIEKLVFYDKNGATMATYTTSEYTANPNGAYASAWSSAIWVVVLGILLAAAGLWSALRAPKTAFSIGGTGVPAYPPVYPPAQPGAYPPAQPGAYPPAQPGAYPPSNPYGQAYQGTEQYPQPNPYGQPGSNPYQQPPQN